MQNNESTWLPFFSKNMTRFCLEFFFEDFYTLMLTFSYPFERCDELQDLRINFARDLRPIVQFVGVQIRLQLIRYCCCLYCCLGHLFLHIPRTISPKQHQDSLHRDALLCQAKRCVHEPDPRSIRRHWIAVSAPCQDSVFLNWVSDISQFLFYHDCVL